MLKNDNVNRILALIVAIVLWAYVVGEVNPITDTVIRNVPITFEHQDSLEKKNLTVLNSSEDEINISISGQRAVVSKLTPADFSVTCDVEGLPLGESVVRLKVAGPDGAKIEHVSTEKVTVTIDEKMTAEKPVKVIIEGSTDETKEPSVVKLDNSKITVTGPKTLVNKVAYMAAYLEAKDITSEVKTFEVKPVPVDNSGKKMSGVKAVSELKVKVDAVLLATKTVALEVPVTNENYGGIEREYSVPKNIVIKGTENELKAVNLIKCKTVDLKKVTADTKISLTPILPEGIQISDASKDLSLSVTIKYEGKKTFEFTEKDINVSAKEGQSYTITSVTLIVEVTGKSSVLDTLTVSDFEIVADAQNLEKGTHSVALNVTCSKDAKVSAITPGSVEIHIS